MQELEKILEEINDRFENLTIADDECRKTALSKHNYEQVKYFQNAMFYTERAKGIVEEIIHKHMGNDGWIPVEERLPDEDKFVLADWEKPNYRKNVTEIYISILKLNQRKEWCGDCGIPNGRVIAWCPLPEPYRPERRRN